MKARVETMSLLVAFIGAFFIALGLVTFGNRAGYLYLVVRPRTILGLALFGAVCSLLFSASYSRAGEVRPTPQMLADAQQAQKFTWPDQDPSSFEYHFRNLGGHILWCAHSKGGNGGFCQKITPSEVVRTDRAAKDYCETAGFNDKTPPHAIYGELSDLAYKCSGGHSSRLPVDMGLDREGYVRSQWKTLP